MLKRYLDEDGTQLVLAQMAGDTQWCASALALTEAHITLCHTGLDSRSLAQATGALRRDWDYMVVVPVDDMCLARSREIGCAQGLRTLDAIHLAAAERIPAPARFLTFDRRQGAAARALGLDVVDIAHRAARGPRAGKIGDDLNHDAMKRMVIQADEELLKRARIRAEERGVSIAQVVRDALERDLGPTTPRKPKSFGVWGSDITDLGRRSGEGEYEPPPWRS